MADPDVFLSYSQKAPEPTVALADALTGRGFRPWYDVNLLAGQYFGHVIDDAIDRSKAVVTIWSPPALTSAWVPAESARALQQNKLTTPPPRRRKRSSAGTSTAARTKPPTSTRWKPSPPSTKIPPGSMPRWKRSERCHGL